MTTRAQETETGTRLDTWSAGPLAERGEKVTLIKPLRIWQYRVKGKTHHLDSVRDALSKPLEAERRELPIGSVGEVLRRDAFLQRPTYRVRFGDIAVENIADHYLERTQ